MNFHYDDSFNHIMSGKAANHCLLKNTHVLHTENEACASAFLSLHSYTMKKYAISFYFRNSASWKVKAFGLFFFFFFSTTQIAVSFAKMCIGLRWAEGVFATFLVSLPLLCCQGNWTVASALCPTPAAARTMLSLHDATDAKDQSLHFGGFVWK